jgi:hypothetical protein
MKHSVDDLLHVVYQHYPRTIPRISALYEDSEEHRRLRSARQRASADTERWRAMLRRLGEAFPECEVFDETSVFESGAGHCCWLLLPQPPSDERPVVLGAIRALPFLVSFLVPYYVVYSTRTRVVESPEEKAKIRALWRLTVDVFVNNTMFVLPRDVVRPDIVAEADRACDDMEPVTTRDILFHFSPDEEPYAARIAREIEAAFGYERMLPDVGQVIVPDVETNRRKFGEARLYDCLMSGGYW